MIWKLYLHPAERCRGVGPRLITAVIDDLPEDSEVLLTEHFAANERAGAFYEREGFRQLRVEPSADGPAASAVVWRQLDLGERRRPR